MILIRKVLILLGGFSLWCGAASVPITRLADLRLMTNQEASKCLPVHVTGVVTWCSPGRVSGGFMIDQNGSGIFVVCDRDLPNGRKRPEVSILEQISVGDKVEIDGVTRASGYTPSLWAAEVHRHGKVPLPAGKELGLGHLLTGTYDAQRVALKGVVTGCQLSEFGDNTWVMVLAGASGKARAVVPAMPGMRPEDMEDAGVLITGVVFTRCNSRQEFVGISIETNRVEDVEIYRRGGSDPFGVSILETGRLRAFVPGGYSQHRRRLEGVVSLSKPGMLYLQGPSGGSRVTTRSPQQIHALGDVVEAAGFVEVYQGTSELAGCLTRKKAKGKPVTPVQLSLPAVADLGSFDGMLVRIDGLVLECHESPAGVEMLLSDSGESFQAILSNQQASVLMLEPNTEVSLVGVAEMAYELGPYFPDRNEVSNVRILLRGPDDIVIHRVPPWWNTRRLLIALSLSVGLVSLLGWAAVLLIRRVRAQSNQLVTEALVHRQVTAAHEAMMEERSRLAGEMHDGLQPMLSGLSFYLDAADSKLTARLMGDASDALGRSRALLSRIREEFRQCIWCLYELGRQTGDLDNELLRLARVQRQWMHAEVKTIIEGTSYPLPASISRGLLLACQEAVENAARHGGAKQITLICSFNHGGIEIAVQDDGCGFVVAEAQGLPGNHFGLASMRQRIERLGGTLDVCSEPGHGTRVTVRLTRQCIERIGANPLISSKPDESITRIPNDD